MCYPYANSTVRLPVVILKISPVSIVLDASKAVWYKRLPPDKASLMPIHPTVPQLAVAVAKVTSASVATRPDVPVAVSNVTTALAYEPPDTSVPLNRHR
jgi:hypothetical protein